MFCILNKSLDPYFNQATEEYFLKNYDENVFMLWQNEFTIVVGKHQNTMAEINVENVKEKGIRVVRRLTGGGAVYHDLGNLNYTFIMGYGDKGVQVDFKKYNQPIKTPNMYRLIVFLKRCLDFLRVFLVLLTKP